MILKKYNSIMQREEDHRNKWAFGLTLLMSIFVFTSFVFYKGFISFGNEGVLAQKGSRAEVATVISADLAPSPLESSKKTFSDAFDGIIKQYDLFKDSLSAVFVPFITGIEVYERK